MSIFLWLPSCLQACVILSHDLPTLVTTWIHEKPYRMTAIKSWKGKGGFKTLPCLMALVAMCTLREINDMPDCHSRVPERSSFISSQATAIMENIPEKLLRLMSHKTRRWTTAGCLKLNIYHSRHLPLRKLVLYRSSDWLRQYIYAKIGPMRKMCTNCNSHHFRSLVKLPHVFCFYKERVQIELWND